MQITGFIKFLYNLLHKYKVEQAEVISRWLFTFVTNKLQEHLFGTFNFS